MPRRFLLVVLALASACASDPAKRQQIVAEETARLRPPAVPLTAFGKFEILQVAMSPEVAVKEDKAAVANQFGEQLAARLQPLFQGWEASAPAEARGKTLTVQATVVSLRIVSGGARFWAGALAGDSFIDVDLSLVEKDTGREIAKERIHKTAGAYAGAWSIGSTDQNLTEYVLDIAQNYFVSNRK